MINKKFDWKKINNNSSKYSKEYTSLRTCPVCNSSKYFKILKYKKYQFFTDSIGPKRVDIQNVQCKNCFFIYQNPSLNQKGLSKLFAEAGMSYGSTLDSKVNQIMWIKKKRLIKKDHSVLDVGCYDGEFLSLLPNNIKKYGIDVDEKIIQTSKKNKKNINFFHDSFETFQIKKKFDLITMMHVLEHLIDPIKVLKNLLNLCKSNGKLVIEVPIIENHFNESLDGFITTQHISHFSKISLINCLNMSGWKIISFKIIKKYNGFRVICEKNFSNKELLISNNEKKILSKYQKKYQIIKNKINYKIFNFTLNEYNIILCAGLHLELFHQLTSVFSKNKDKKFAIIDNDKNKIGKKWRGIKIYSWDKLIKNKLKLNNYKFIIFSFPHQEIIYKQLRKIKVKNSNILKFYSKIQRY